MSYTPPQIQSVHFPKFRAGLPSMAGKTVAITGTTSGTGKSAAHTVAELGAKVLLLNRASTRSEASLADLSAAVPGAEFHAVECDLQSFASVKAAAAKIVDLCPEGVHVLCNNAGVMALADVATDDGYDVQMQTNHLSHFLLTRELMPLLELAADASGDARVVNHSSVARMSPGKQLIGDYLEKRGGSLGGDGNAILNALFRGPRWVRYNQSKLANAAFTAALHARLRAAGSKVKALVAHPGFANTNLQQTSVKAGGMGSLLTGMMMKTSQSIDDGALGILSGICLAEAESGQFYGPGAGAFSFKGAAQPFALESFYDNAETRELLWEKSEDAIGQSFDI
ncbi:MAG: NAD(P)-dependent dehydrogenase (short-subunit alcohol dehydrogenase family) [Bradymonadia bacterium]|jgi:NAD(P)-dependent dehydrogenase (short-subunit alcohol dehydrogenase family)